ncbi:MAG TPA: alpha-amylase family glycosyl hydrolase, partial [Deinococcales bacterium]|nr:alpha-amylase family glycosyl hydrolase [Deinococcales bacterium]
AVLDGEASPEAYLAGATDGVPNEELALEELLLLWLHNANPAFAPHRELFDEAPLVAASPYRQVTGALTAFMDAQPGLPGYAEFRTLLQLLRAPALASPDSLSGQLQFLLRRFPALLGPHLRRLLASLDLIAEETKPVFPPGPGGADVQVFDYTGLDEEAERFSPDRDWMPSLVLIAKNAFVWLDQLSRKYGREIRRLDQSPGEELDELARRGITGLWLIGLWERSKASRRIKQLMGNADAVASAYSLDDYTIAWDLGGEEACARLREQAWQRGLRLASDMVPNHTGLDGRWVMEHPDWFIGLPYSPFPNYSFNGPNLSEDGRAAVYLEDHYYDRSDAAVVFKRVGADGDVRFIYHGNDGTSMPWNDTAQLDYLNPEAREAVIQTILHVARQFPVIRFDAAMTLAKRHIQRLWYPEPGHGGAIASRAGMGLTKQEFDARIPMEFWREVVDRVAAEAPDTLLLAEAFWMMEGYFVRTLGMHRVYNSAFMNMLRDERNGEYREIIKNTVAFEPQILKRFVNFMNNPDERTAVEQFGKGDKYFGVCTVMVTLPGLPMIGHGQIEGFAEKYGMEYQRAYWDETPDPDLLARHERQIFPLMRRRGLFANSEQFRLFDLETEHGPAGDVYAYSNRRGQEAGLVVYHNRFGDTSGWLRESAPYATGDGPRRERLADALGLNPDAGEFVAFRDQVSGLEFLRETRQLLDQGLFVRLGAYQHHVFLDFHQLRADGGPFRELHDRLNGAGVPNLARAASELRLRPVLEPYRALLDALSRATSPDDLREPLLAFYTAARGFAAGPGTTPSENAVRRLKTLAGEVVADLSVILQPEEAAAPEEA